MEEIELRAVRIKDGYKGPGHGKFLGRYKYKSVAHGIAELYMRLNPHMVVYKFSEVSSSPPCE